jgi:trimeric autotransporter adhesin
MACFASNIAIRYGTNCGFTVGNQSCISNTAIGLAALAANTTGYCNTAIGAKALFANTTGNRNTAGGVCALTANTTGTCNTAIGYKAGSCMTTGNSLTAIGAYAAECTTGNFNTVVGAKAGYGLTTGTCNVLMGRLAGGKLSGGSCNVAVGYQALEQATSNDNVAIGYRVAPDLTTGACNIFVGYCNGIDISTTNFHIGIGHYGGPSKTTGHTAWGNSSITYNGIASKWSNISDCRDKTNIEDLDEKLGLDFIRSLDTVSFNWDNRESYVQKCGFEYGQKDGTLSSPKKSYGFIAQQMKEVLDNLNTNFDALKYNEDKDTYRITYAHMIAPLVKAIQQTIQRIETLETLAG